VIFFRTAFSLSLGRELSHIRLTLDGDIR
jgi:hypothetical protein